MNRTYCLLLASAACATALTAADLKTYGNSLSRQTWTWDKTKADQVVVEGQPQAVTYDHQGTLATGLRSDSGSSAATLKLRAGPARIDNGLPELPPEPYASNTGTTYAYPVPGGYTGAFGLYAGDVSAYAAAQFPNAMNVYSGTYTQSILDAYLANPVGLVGEDLREAMAASRFDLTITEFETGAKYLSFQLRIQGLGPTVANVENGTYITTYDALRQILPVTLTVGGTEVTADSAELLSYADIGVGSRHAYVGGGVEEVWEFVWDLEQFGELIDEAVISFVNYPSAVISAIAVDQFIPEPSTYALLLGLGIGAAAVVRRRSAARA